MDTAIAAAWTEYAETQTAIPTGTPTFTPPTTLPGPYAIVPPNPDQQVYIDPDGWYSVNFPANMKPTDKPNSFTYQGSFFETGYLPEMGYMPDDVSVCAWLANMELTPEQSGIDWSNHPCSAISEYQSGYRIRYDIQENPGADPEHRFIYIKSESLWPQYTFSWLKPPSQTKQERSPAPLNDEEGHFWAKAISMPAYISVNEYKLPPPPLYLPNNELPENPFQYIPTSTPTQLGAIQIPAPTPRKIPLQELGYELRTIYSPTGQVYDFQLYRDGRVLIDHVSHVSDIFDVPTDSGQIIAFIVEVKLGQQHYVIENDIIHSWDGYIQYISAPILYQGELLWARVNGGHVEIVKSDGTVIFTLVWPNFPNHYPRLHTWNGHWILEASDFVIQDGENLNKKLDYQQIFNWGLVQHNPTYFFRKGSKVGISFNGDILPLQYDDVWHGQCCGGGAYNPGIGANYIHFFGKRDGVWYHVTVDFD